MSGCTVFCKIDLVRDFHHIPVALEDVHKTAVIAPFGLFDFLRMPFGLRNSAQTFKRFMHYVFQDISFIFIYIDDLLVASRDKDEHMCHLRIVYQRLQEFGLRINVSKCKFGVSSLEFLGQEITQNGIRPSASRVQLITYFPAPTSLHQAQRFVGMVNFYHRFVPHLSQRLAPIYAHLVQYQRSKSRSLKTFSWPGECDKVKNALAQATLLSHPMSDSR